MNTYEVTATLFVDADDEDDAMTRVGAALENLCSSDSEIWRYDLADAVKQEETAG